MYILYTYHILANLLAITYTRRRERKRKRRAKQTYTQKNRGSRRAGETERCFVPFCQIVSVTEWMTLCLVATLAIQRTPTYYFCFPHLTLSQLLFLIRLQGWSWWWQCFLPMYIPKQMSSRRGGRIGYITNNM